jgi:hypothetical protein
MSTPLDCSRRKMYFDIIDALVNKITKTQSDVCIIAHFAYNLTILSPNLEPENIKIPHIECS